MQDIEMEEEEEETAGQPSFKRGDSLLDEWASYSDPFTFTQDWF